MIEQELKQIEEIYQLVANYLVEYSFQVIGAILILIIGMIAAGMLSRAAVRLLTKRNVDVTLTAFLGSLTKIIVFACFLIISLGKFGITVAPFVAALGAATLGIGLALQGPISNYGAGVAIILARTFKVGDTVTISEWFGVVQEIRLAYTLLETEDGEIITIPNKHVIGEIIQNSFASRVVETIIGIDYGDSPELAIDTIRTVLSDMDCVSQEPSFQVGIDGFGDFSINIGLRYWVPTQSYYESKYLVNQRLYSGLKEAGIRIPFPRRDVYLFNND